MKPLRLILRTGAAVFGVSAIALIIAPSLFLSLLGLPDEPALVWSMAMIGVTLVALTGNMAVASFTASDAGVRVAAMVMLVSASSLGLITLLIPVAYTWFTVAYAAIGFGFGLAYVIGLFVVGRAR